MSRGMPKKQVFASVLHGIEQASESFCKISGWESLWYAPEYFLTCAIASALAESGSGETTIEDGVRQTMKIAGANGPGKPRNGLRKGGRFDLVLWWKQGTPRAVIEVKHPLYSPSKVFEDDIIRIRDVLDASLKTGGSFQFGGLSFWTGANQTNGEPEGVKKRIEDNAKSLRKSAQGLAGDQYVVTLHPGKIKTEDNGKWGWAAMLLVLEPK